MNYWKRLYMILKSALKLSLFIKGIWFLFWCLYMILESALEKIYEKKVWKLQIP